MARQNAYPKKVDTDFGEAVVKLVPSDKATKIHKCCFCETETEYLEAHLLILPIQHPGNRRYSHTRCFEQWVDMGLAIRLSKNLPYLSDNALGMDNSS
jgi:hypothetical protein